MLERSKRIGVVVLEVVVNRRYSVQLGDGKRRWEEKMERRLGGADMKATDETRGWDINVLQRGVHQQCKPARAALGSEVHWVEWWWWGYCMYCTVQYSTQSEWGESIDGRGMDDAWDDACTVRYFLVHTVHAVQYRSCNTIQCSYSYSCALSKYCTVT
jgi:hypothetical protein